MPRKPKQLGKEYKGALNKPTRRTTPPKPRGIAAKILFPEATDNYQEDSNKWLGESTLNVISDQLPKLMLLMDHYDIQRDDPERWFLLSLSLARNHVPGFRVEEKNQDGRKKEWDVAKDTFLYLCIIEKIYTGKLDASKTISWACEQLAKDSFWKNAGCTKKTLQNRYAQAEKSVLSQIYINAINKYGESNHHSDFARDIRDKWLQILKPSQ